MEGMGSRSLPWVSQRCNALLFSLGSLWAIVLELEILLPKGVGEVKTTPRDVLSICRVLSDPQGLEWGPWGSQVFPV